jgi:AcrR family transcriptional regulator
VSIAVRAPGRPRDPATDQAIVDAALALFSERGCEGVSVEGVATRAGVGKATIYRRYPTKNDLVVAVVSGLTEAEVPDIDSGCVADDLRALGQGFVRLLTRTVAGSIVRQLIAERSRDPELARVYERFLTQRRAVTIDMVRRAIERGDLQPDTDPEVIVDLLRGPILVRFLNGERLDARVVDGLVDAIVRAFGA